MTSPDPVERLRERVRGIVVLTLDAEMRAVTGTSDPYPDSRIVTSRILAAIVEDLGVSAEMIQDVEMGEVLLGFKVAGSPLAPAAAVLDVLLRLTHESPQRRDARGTRSTA